MKSLTRQQFAQQLFELLHPTNKSTLSIEPDLIIKQRETPIKQVCKNSSSN